MDMAQGPPTPKNADSLNESMTMGPVCVLFCSSSIFLGLHHNPQGRNYYHPTLQMGTLKAQKAVTERQSHQPARSRVQLPSARVSIKSHP